MTIWVGGNWNGSDLPQDELRATTGHEIVFDAEPRGEILFGQPDLEKALALPNLRWIHITSAGYTRYDTPDFRERLRAKGAVLTNSSSVYDEPCAQHLLAMMLAFARRLPQAQDEQRDGRAWSTNSIRAASRLLGDDKALVVGYGAIARRLVELLKPFDMEIVAVRREPKGDETVPTLRIEDLDRLLHDADHIVNILPANASTDGLFDEARFSRIREGAYFYNIGRGTTVDQNALMASLPRLSGAFLDVTDPEPLPQDHPLWAAPNVFITPHTAGGHHGEEIRLVRHFLDNLRRFDGSEPLRDVVIA